MSEKLLYSLQDHRLGTHRKIVPDADRFQLIVFRVAAHIDDSEELTAAWLNMDSKSLSTCASVWLWTKRTSRDDKIGLRTLQ